MNRGLIKRNRASLIVALTLMIVLGCFLIHPSEAAAFTISDKYSTNRCFTSGWFYIYITNLDGTDSKVRINVSRSSAPSYSTIQDKATKWDIKVDSSSKNTHNVKLTSGTVTTVKDINNQYYIMPIKFTYDMPAHHQFVKTVARKNRCEKPRMDFKGENGSESTVKTTGDHKTSKSARKGTAFVNLINAGVATYSGDRKRYNGCEMEFEIERRTQVLKTKHWAQGFNKGDLNASLVNTDPASVSASRKSIVLKQTTTAGTYNCCTSVNPRSFAVKSPKGYKLKEEMYTNAITGTSSTHPLGPINLGTANRTVSMYQTPVNYTISYNLAGGTNHASNPKTYNICYPVTFAAPTKAGAKFLGWYEGSTRITGINQGKSNGGLTTANFSSQMNARTIGNKTITAKWDNPPVITSPIVNNQDGNKVAPFLKTMDGKEMLIIQKDDKFTAEKYQTARDEVDGDLTAKVKVIKNLPLENGRATKSGRYEVTYQVADSSGLTANKTIHVLVNEPPKPVTLPRNFYKGDSATEAILLEQVSMDDKEDGKTKAISSKVISIDGNANKTSLNTEKEGTHKIVCMVEDSLKGTTEGEFVAAIHEDIQETNAKRERYPRFIDGDSIPSLGSNSIWMTDSDYYGSLASSLERDTPIKRYDLN